MKLCRYGPAGHEKPAILDTKGQLRDMSQFIADWTPDNLSPERLQTLARLDPTQLPLVTNSPRMGPPLTGVGKFIGIGLNYRDHAEEAGLALPEHPVIFMKATSCISGPDDPVRLPPGATQADWELELGVVIGRTARLINESDAPAHIAGYCIVNDVSEREYQFRTSQWDQGKGCDTFGPIGPWLVTTDDIANPQSLDMWLEVNGVRRQASNTSAMIFSINRIVAECSRVMTLFPGDVITTGTPAGVGMSQRPHPIWLRQGDHMRLWIEGLGEQNQTVMA